MPQVRKQEYTRPIPEGATRTKMTIWRRGKDIEVPAVRFKGTDGRPVTAPVVQAGKGAGTHYRAESVRWYGTVKGKPVQLLTNKAASETMLNDLVIDQERGSVGLSDPFAKAAKVPLVDHIVSFELHLEAEGYNPFDKKQTASRVRKALVDGCKFSRLLAVDAERVTAWLSAKRKGDTPHELPESRDEFTVKDASEILGVSVHAVHAAVKRLEHVPSRRGKRTTLTRETVQTLLDRRSKGMGEQTAAHYTKALVQFGSWLVTSKRAGSNPFATLSQPQVVENRHRRRVLNSEELRRLIAATKASARSFRGLSGEDRSLLYAAAYYTAFRAGGLASLTPECFHLEDPIPAVTLPVRGNKARRELINAMPADLVDALRSQGCFFVRNRSPLL